MTTLDQALDLIEQLPKAQQEQLMEILHRRNAEESRREFTTGSKRIRKILVHRSAF